jgi:ATP-dependent Lhr-like helicase
MLTCYQKFGSKAPFFKEIINTIVDFRQLELTPDDLVSFVEAPKVQKYDEFIPNNLLRKAFANDYLDVAELRQILRSW